MGRNVFPVVFDGHNDVLDRLGRPDGGGPAAFFEQGEKGHLDLPRAREGGFGGGIFAVWVPSPKTPERTPRGLPPALDAAYALRYALAAVAMLFRIEDRSDGEFRVVRTAAEIERCLDEEVMPAVLHFEGADAIDTNLDALHVLYRAGLRSLGLVWGRPNAFAEGVAVHFQRSPDTGPGLTEAGKELVRACNDLGIMIDVSHLNERGFWDVAALTDAPLVASHSNAYALCPSTRKPHRPAARRHSRLRRDGRPQFRGQLPARGRDQGREHTPGRDGPAHRLPRRAGRGRRGRLRLRLRRGLDPREIGDVAGLPRLMSALADRGYDDMVLRKLAYENWVRVLHKTWGE